MPRISTKQVRARKSAEKQLRQLQQAFDSMPPKMLRQFVNALVSDAGPQNPKLGSLVRTPNAPQPPTGMDGQPGDDAWDYFRDPRTPTALKDQPASSITPARIISSVRMRWNPIKGLTPEKSVGYMDQFRLGYFRQAAMTWDQIQRRDYQLQIVWPKAAKSVSRHGYDILVREEVIGDQQSLAEEQQDFLKNFYAGLSVTSALEADQSGGFSLLVRQMMEARLHRYAVHDLAWVPQPDGNLTAKLTYCPLWWFEGTRGKLRFLDSEFQIYGRDMLPGEWLVTVGDGLMEAILAVYIFKWMALKSALALLDRFGQPGIHGKTTAVKGSSEWNDFVEAVQTFAQEWSAVTNVGGEISLVEASGSITGEGPFGPMIDKMDRAITQMLRGGDLGTSGQTQGVGASLQADESEILETDNAKWIEETLDQRLTNFALEWKFGADCPKLAYLKLRTTPRQNLQDDIAVDQFLINNGAPLGKLATLERYKRPMPKEGEELLSAPAPKPMPGKDVKPSPTEETPEEEPDAPEETEFANAGEATEKLAGQFSEDTAADLEPILQAVAAELDAITQIADARLRQKKIDALLAKIDSLAADALLAPKSADSMAAIIAAGLSAGAHFANSKNQK